MILGKLPIYKVWKKYGSESLKKRRFSKIMDKIEMPEGRPLKVLEVGCANGMDFIRFTNDKDFDISAVDLNFYEFERKDIKFYQADAAKLPFGDKEFDVVVSIGLLEHIEPMEKLCEVIAEFDRVGKHQVSVVPSVSTLIEPHCAGFRFPLRLHKKMFSEQIGMPLHLNFFSEHTWTKFSGFSGCQVGKFYYMPPVIKNTIIYK